MNNMRHNFACALCVYSKDKNASLEMLGPMFDTITDTFLPYVKGDPDIDLNRRGGPPCARRPVQPGKGAGGKPPLKGLLAAAFAG